MKKPEMPLILYGIDSGANPCGDGFCDHNHYLSGGCVGTIVGGPSLGPEVELIGIAATQCSVWMVRRLEVIDPTNEVRDHLAIVGDSLRLSNVCSGCGSCKRTGEPPFKFSLTLRRDWRVRVEVENLDAQSHRFTAALFGKPKL